MKYPVLPRQYVVFPFQPFVFSLDRVQPSILLSFLLP